MQDVNELEVIVPEGIKDPQQYIKWYKMKWTIDHNPNRYYEYVCNDGEKIVLDLYAPVSITQKKFADKLPPELWEELRKQINGYKSQMAKCTVEQRRINSGSNKMYSDPTVILLDRSTELLEMFGKYMNCDEVHKAIHEKWQARTVTIGTVRKFYSRYKDQILRLRASYDDDYSDISLHSKRARLGQLNYLLVDRRQIYDKTHKLEDSREIRSILEQAKGEVEGNKLQLDVSGRIDIDMTINIEHQIKAIGGLTLAQMIVSMTASKLGVNPLFIMSRLSNSVYSKFNGFKRMTGIMTENPFKPSDLIFNFEEIKEKNKEYEASLPSQLYTQPIEDANVINESRSIKAMLQEKIKAKLEAANKGVEKINDGEYNP